MKLSDADIESILNEVQEVLATVTKSEKDKAASLLAKNDEEDSAGGDDDDAGAPPGADAGPPPGDAAPPMGADAPPADDMGSPADAPPDGDPAASGPADPAALQAEYAKLPLDELKMHAEAAMAALQAAMGGAGGDAAGAPPPGADAGAPPMAPAMKKEMKVDGNGGQVRKSQKDAEVEVLKKDLAQTQEMANRLTAAFHSFVTKPMRKAETGIPAPGTKPPEDPKLSKSEAIAKLKGKIRDSSLSKKDREAMNEVFLGAKDPFAPDVAHLLK